MTDKLMEKAQKASSGSDTVSEHGWLIVKFKLRWRHNQWQVGDGSGCACPAANKLTIMTETERGYERRKHKALSLL